RRRVSRRALAPERAIPAVGGWPASRRHVHVDRSRRVPAGALVLVPVLQGGFDQRTADRQLHRRGRRPRAVPDGRAGAGTIRRDPIASPDSRWRLKTTKATKDTKTGGPLDAVGPRSGPTARGARSQTA